MRMVDEFLSEYRAGKKDIIKTEDRRNMITRKMAS